MRTRRVKKLTVLGHDVQLGIQIRATGVADWPWNSGWHWKVAQFVEDHAPIQQCWSELVDWALGPDTAGMDRRERVASLLPWRPLPQGCRDSAVENGTCYCGNHDAGGWRPLCSNCPGCWPNNPGTPVTNTQEAAN